MPPGHTFARNPVSNLSRPAFARSSAAGGSGARDPHRRHVHCAEEEAGDAVQIVAGDGAGLVRRAQPLLQRSETVPRDDPRGQRYFIGALPGGVLLDVIQVIEPSAEYAAHCVRDDAAR